MEENITQSRVKVYHGPLEKKWPIVWFLAPHYPEKKQVWGRFGDSVWGYFDEPLIDIVENPEEADFLLIPYTYNNTRYDLPYINEFIHLSTKFNKKIIIIFPGDSDEEVVIPNAIIFRNSQYRSRLRSNEIIMPAVADDLLEGSLELKTKSDKPRVGFCGWASFKTWLEAIKFFVKGVVYQGPYKQGLWFRRLAIAVLSHSRLVITSFIIRRSYSGNEKTISLNKNQARKEYIQNIRDNDFTLCPKGDGNYSIRFFEVLSLGRIPIFVDTDTPLPLEDQIDYDAIMVRVNYRDIKEIDHIISRTYALWSTAEFFHRQTEARRIFTEKLRLDSFFKITLTSNFLSRYGHVT